GAQGDVDALMAKGVAASVRQQLADLGFDGAPFDRVRSEAEGLLARQDAIGLAKLLARAYGGFCPEQYDNEMNPEAHRSGTGPELEEQLRAAGADLGSAEVICAFGTGGTATGLSRYSAEKHGRKMVRVVFPKAGQDVAGIRTREKAVGLAFYKPQEYLGEHEVDFEATKPLSRHFNSKGYDVGESGALALYATMQMINFGKSGTMVVLVADGASKYSKAVQNLERPKRDQVRLEEARADMSAYARVVWTHAMLVPTDAGISVIAKSLGVEKEKIAVAKTKDVQSLVSGRSPSGEFEALLPGDGRSVLLVCMSGSTSLFLARALDGKGVRAESLVGGIGALPEARSVPMPGLLRVGQ
ncbi:MAG TPA: pyridoxal-phosphate dependent enzyme, partial [Nitrososphaerales archaeon]|nr:pyridoxal-phosphate dependent enzyme [Nitrososphaerales archaeon]